MFYRAIRIKGVEYQLAVNLSGKGAPTTSTEGLLGMVYMDEDTGDLYRCISAADTGYIWKQVAEGGEIDTTLTQSGKAADAKVTGEKFDKISKEKADKTEIPKVFGWASAELPFTEAQISGTVGGAGFVVNPTNFADGKTYFRYHAGATNFTWTNPNPQKGAVTITAKGYSQYGGTNGTRLLTIYDDGTYGPTLYIVVNGESRTVTVTTDANKTLAKITGNYDLENWVLLDMEVLSIVADYPSPTGTVKTVNGVEPDENGNVKIDIPESSGGTDISLGMTGAAVGQIARITAVDENGVPTAWEAADLAANGEKAWRFLRSFTLPDDPSTDESGVEWVMCKSEGYTDQIAQWKFDTDENGDAFALTELKILCKHARGRSVNYFGVSNQNGYLGYGNLFCNRSVFGNKEELTGMVIFIKLENGVVYSSLRTNDRYYGTPVLWTNYLINSGESVITSVKLGTFDDSSVKPGAFYEIWGR